MGQHYAKSLNTFLTDCQSNLSQLDEMLLGFVFSVESVHTTTKQLLHQLKQDIKQDGTEMAYHQRNLELTLELLTSVENGLWQQKTTLLQEISQIARMIRNRSEISKPITDRIPALKELKIDEYLKSGTIPDIPVKTKEAVNVECHGVPSKEKTNEETERKISSMKEENLRCAKKILALQENTEQLMKENNELRNKITKLEKESIQVLPVQLYCQKRSDQMGLVLQEVMTQLSEKARLGKKKLAFIVCEQPLDIQPELPLLAFCFNASRIGTDATNAIQGIKQLENTALLILHHKDEHALPKQSSERVLVDPEFKSLGVIFDIAFLAGKGIYLCERNTLAIDGIKTFLVKVMEASPLKIN